jgi:RNA polymerase sigma-70 factor (ECF subfamily)
MFKTAHRVRIHAEHRPAPEVPILGRVADAEDIRWLADLYERYSDHVREIILRHGGPGIEVEDLLHDIFLAAYRKLRVLRGYVDPGGWLHLAALREVWSVKRRARLWRSLSLALVPQPEVLSPQESDFMQHETARWVYTVLDKLPARQREALVLFYFENLTSVEIGRLLGCPEETVRSRIFHGKRAFVRIVARELRRSLPLQEVRG